MDVSPEYVKMCEKAEEIQGAEEKYGDNIYACSRCHEITVPKSGYHLIKCGGDYNAIWLPRQDQLQEMFEKHSIWTLTLKFELFLRTEKTYNINSYPFQFASMEQLWLAFVMKENDKVWDGEEWIGEE